MTQSYQCYSQAGFPISPDVYASSPGIPVSLVKAVVYLVGQKTQSGAPLRGWGTPSEELFPGGHSSSSLVSPAMTNHARLQQQT